MPLVVGLLAAALVGVPIAGIVGFAGAIGFSHDCGRRGAGVSCGDIESQLLMLPLGALAVGLVVGEIVGGRAVAAHRRPGRGSGSRWPSRWPVRTSRPSGHATRSSTPSWTPRSGRRSPGRLAGADVGEHAVLRHRRTRCAGDRRLRRGPPRRGGRSAERGDWVAADAALRRVAGRYGYTGRPLRLPLSPDSVTLTLEGPEGEALRVTAAASGRQAGASFHTTRCLLPAAKKPTS